MNIPGSFTYTDVMYINNAEPTLPLESVAGFATLTFAPLPRASATPTGLANDATAYTATATVDGTPVAVSVTGSAAQTFADLVTEVQTDLGAAATVTLVGDDIVITSATTGTTSTVVVADVDLFSSVIGANFRLQANVSTKGHVKMLRWEKLDSHEQAELYTIMAAVNPTATDWVHASDIVTLADGVNPVEVTTALTGLAAGTYSLDVTVDGVTKTVSFAVALNSTVTAAFDSFAAAMAVAFPTATTTMVDGTNVVDFKVTTATPGPEGDVTIVAGTTNDFIAAVAALTGVADTTAVGAGVAGATGTVGTIVGYATWFEALSTVKAPNGFPVLSSVGPVALVEHEDKPQMRYLTKKDLTYWNGSAWVVWTA